ncbi:hypothetical protein TorRG33x02_140560, partial [Trema orientale]
EQVVTSACTGEVTWPLMLELQLRLPREYYSHFNQEGQIGSKMANSKFAKHPHRDLNRSPLKVIIEVELDPTRIFIPSA